MKVTIQDSKTSVTVRPRDFKVTVSGARGPQGPPGEAGASEWGDITGDIIDQTDLYNALQAKVPYTGATQDVNLGEYGAQLGNLEFDNTPTNVPTTAGSVYWNDTDGTLNIVLKGGQTISRIGETQHIRALNNTGAQIARGKVVYVVGAQGQRLTIALADADTEILSKDTIGFTAETIADGAEGFVIVQGVINNVSTTGMTDGATVYLSQTAGSYTTTPPADPAHLVILGFIVNGGSGGAGSIYVKVDNGYELEELHNVSNSAKTTPVAADALFLRDSADNNLWKRLTWTNALAGVKSHMDTFKSVAGGYASLDGSGKVPSSELPSYVDDVVEVANYAALPGTGETGKIYVTLDTNKCYRWSGSVYVQVAQGVDTLTTTGTSGAATLVGSTLNIPQYQGVLTNPVTGTGTAGQVAYFNGTSAVTGSANLFWDAANGRLGIGTNAPTQKLEITAGNIIIDNNSEYRSKSTGGSSLPVLKVDTSNNLLAGSVFLSSQFISYTSTSFRWYQYPGSVLTERMQLNAAGNLLIQNGGTFTDNGQRLQVYGSTLLRGSTTTSSTTALLVQNSTPTDLLSVRDDGLVTLANNCAFLPTGTGASDNRLQIFGGTGGAVGTTNLITLRTNNNITSTSGSPNLVAINTIFLPTSGTATFSAAIINPTINQTGGANGITRGLYVNPTLTSAADWRSIEWSNNTGWGLYGAGTAPNYLAGALGIGGTVDTTTSYNLRVSRQFSGVATGRGIVSDSQITAGPSTISYFSSAASATATANVTNIRHFYAAQGTFTSGSVVTNQSGFSVSDALVGGTNNYGFRGDIPSGTGRWNIYMDGTAANYLAGNTSIGTTTSSGRLTVQGSGTTSATKAFVVNNSTPTAIFEVLDNGRINQTIPGASNNTIFGTGAGASASLSGGFNTFYGVNAGAANTTGASNSLIGYNAGAALTTGGSNVYVGSFAGFSNQSATTNTGAGTFAMLNHTTGGDNIGQGFNAARFYADGTTSATSFSLSTYLGVATRVSGAGVTNEIAIGHTAIGNGSNTATLGNTSITATYLRGNINYTDGGNFVIGTTTGTKIGTATTQKIGLWNATPIVQPTTAVAAATRVGGGGTTVTDTDTFDGYTIAQLVKALRNMGALA